MILTQARGARAVLLLLGGVLPLTIASHWFRTDDFLLLEYASKTPPWRVWEFFGAGGVFFWRPLQSWLMSLLWTIGGLNPLLYNIALVGGWFTALWQFERLAFDLTSSESTAACALGAAIVFAPSTTMNCVWVALMGASWGSVLAILAMRWWLRAMRGEASSHLALAAAALLACAILFKESLACTIALVPVLLCATPRDGRARASRCLAWLAIPIIAACVTAMMSARAVSGAEDITRNYPHSPLGSVPANIGAMLNAVVWPLGALGDATSNPVHRFSRVVMMMWPVLPVVILLLALVRPTAARLIGAAWAMIGCLPAALLEHHLDSRYLHWPAFGVALCIADLLRPFYPVLAGHVGSPGRPYKLKLVTAGFVTGFVGISSLMAWTAAMRAIAERGEVGRALHHSLVRAPLPAERTLILLAIPSSMPTNGGIGLTALARMTTHRSDIACELESLYSDAGWRAKFDSEFPHILRWVYADGRFGELRPVKP